MVHCTVASPLHQPEFPGIEHTVFSVIIGGVVSCGDLHVLVGSVGHVSKAFDIPSPSVSVDSATAQAPS